MSKVIVLGHGNPYDFKDDSGSQIKGVKVSYINSDPITGSGAKGFLPLQVSLDPSVLTSLSQIPGIYEIDYGIKPGKNNMPVAVINSFKYIKPVQLFSNAV